MIRDVEQLLREVGDAIDQQIEDVEFLLSELYAEFDVDDKDVELLSKTCWQLLEKQESLLGKLTGHERDARQESYRLLFSASTQSNVVNGALTK